MKDFICPVCKLPLILDNRTYKCENGHCYDLSKSGYVNLLLSQQSKLKRHGDDKVMAKARRDFLDKGYYLPLLNGLKSAVSAHFTKDSVLLDAGCGEGWYTSNLYDYLSGLDLSPNFLAVDISKDALDLLGKRSPNIKRAVASVYKLPVSDNSCDVVINIFAPIATEEYLRVLKPNGILICAIALEDHLLSLKQKVYENAYKNEIGDLNLDGFRLINRNDVKGEIEISSNEDILTLFKMTPYYYKTSKEDFEKLTKLQKLKTQTEFGILIYKKCGEENE